VQTAESNMPNQTRSQTVARIADCAASQQTAYLVISDCSSPAVFDIFGSKRIGVTWHHRSRDHSIPRRPFPICFFRQFLADRTNGRAIATLFCLSVCPSVCDVMYCG